MDSDGIQVLPSNKLANRVNFKDKRKQSVIAGVRSAASKDRAPLCGRRLRGGREAAGPPRYHRVTRDPAGASRGLPGVEHGTVSSGGRALGSGAHAHYL